MSAVVPAFVEWSWRTFGRLVRLNADVMEGNRGSWRVLEKAGFVKNGVLGEEVSLGMVRPGMEG